MVVARSRTESGTVQIRKAPSTDDGGYELLADQWLPREVGELFPFFAEAENLEILTPPWLKFSIKSVRPITMRVGTVIDYRLTLRFVPLRWQSEITAWDPPHRFVDEQRRGPYRFWIHEHTFEPTDGGTLLRDHVRYGVLGGRVVHGVVVGRDLLKIFNYRQRKMRELFGKASEALSAETRGDQG